MTNFSKSFSRTIVCLLLGMLLVGMSGCGGCRNETPQERQARLQKEADEKQKREEEEKKRKEAEEKKKQFYVEAPISKPSDTAISRVKRGHWMTVTQLMKANYRDWGGETTLTVVDQSGREVPIAETPFTLSSSRPVQLAKGRPRYVENVFLVPGTNASASVKCILRERNYGAVVGGIPLGTKLSPMDPYQYFFVVLAKEPERYTFVKSLNAVRVPQDDPDEMGGRDLRHYEVLLPDISKQVPLPDNPMCWTTIAYILWDEVDPGQLDRQRREALIDWLHWGGQLVINGPDSLKLLENSFLEPYLPATDGGATEITQADVKQLTEYWTEKDVKRSAREPKQLKLARDWSGIEFDLAEGVDDEAGLAASTGGLLVERRIGRGRIVVSRMQLAERDLQTWSPHYDDLFNAGIMRRPPRVWAMSDYGMGLAGGLHGEWAEHPGHIRDSQYVTHLRLFSRDVHRSADATNYQQVEVEPVNNAQMWMNGGDTKRVEYRDPEVVGGIGSWNDFNATSEAAREALREAAGVRVPDASFVVTCLSVYLVVLVPLNWLFFRALGRVEYAWIAAPIVALLGTAVVVKQAQLDIGFVRAQTEIALLEIHGDYPRAHLSRYTALYTSLSTTYDMSFEDPTAVAAPFPRGDFKMLPGQKRSRVELTQSKDTHLEGLQVSSATTDMVHSEQMLTLDGPLVLQQQTGGGQRVINQTQLNLESVAVVKRVEHKDGPQLLGCWLGDLKTNTGASLSFTPVEEGLFATERARPELSTDEQLNLEPMFRLALDPAHMDVGEVRLVARADKVLSGVAITPSAAQVRGAALIVAHLDRAPLDQPEPDRNSPRDVMQTDESFDEEELGEGEYWEEG